MCSYGASSTEETKSCCIWLLTIHMAHLMVRVLDDTGSCIQQRRVWTRPPEVDRFLGWLACESADQGGFIAMVEECGFTLWLEQKLQEHGCWKVVKIQPLRKQPQKTDGRDATAIGELLWANRERILRSERLLQERQVESPSEQDRCARLVINERQFLKKSRNELIYRIKDVLRRFNVQHDCPTRGLFTKAGRRWLEQVQFAGGGSTDDRSSPGQYGSARPAAAGG